MSRVTYECDNGSKFIFLVDSSGTEVVDLFCPGYYMQRFTLDTGKDGEMANAILKFSINPARVYVTSKGRLPKDATELMEWLNEFADFETRRCDAILQVYQEHMNLCTQPIIYRGSHDRTE